MGVVMATWDKATPISVDTKSDVPQLLTWLLHLGLIFRGSLD